MDDRAGFVEFCRWQTISGDVDPAYPVLADLARVGDLDTETVCELLLLYVAFYDLGSALSLWLDGVRLETLDAAAARFPTGTERRGLRGGANMLDHVADLVEARRQHGSWRSFLSPAFGPDRRSNWQALQDQLRTVRRNGRWAAYKTGELLAAVACWPVEPTDAGHDFSTGPRHGLATIRPDTAEITGNGPAAVAALDAITETERAATEAELAGLPLPIERFETMLCDWHGVTTNRYYVGHDIDMMLAQIAKPHVSSAARDAVLSARARAFDDRWLGERGGWPGPRPPLRRLWTTSREIRWWT